MCFRAAGSPLGRDSSNEIGASNLVHDCWPGRLGSAFPFPPKVWRPKQRGDLFFGGVALNGQRIFNRHNRFELRAAEDNHIGVGRSGRQRASHRLNADAGRLAWLQPSERGDKSFQGRPLENQGPFLPWRQGLALPNAFRQNIQKAWPPASTVRENAAHCWRSISFFHFRDHEDQRNRAVSKSVRRSSHLRPSSAPSIERQSFRSRAAISKGCHGPWCGGPALPLPLSEPSLIVGRRARPPGWGVDVERRFGNLLPYLREWLG